MDNKQVLTWWQRIKAAMPKTLTRETDEAFAKLDEGAAEPVAWIDGFGNFATASQYKGQADWKPLYTAPQPTPSPAGSPLGRDADWTLAIAKALGADSGYSVPIVPDVEAFRRLFAALRAQPQAAQAVPQTLRGCIDALIDKHGTLRAVSRETKVDVGYLSRLHSGEKDDPSDETLSKLGISRHVLYTLASPTTKAAGEQSEGGKV